MQWLSNILGLVDADTLDSNDCLYYVETLEFPAGTRQMRTLNSRSIFRTPINSTFLRSNLEDGNIRIFNNSINNFCILVKKKTPPPIVMNIRPGAVIELKVAASCNLSVFQELMEGEYRCIYHNVEMKSGTHFALENEIVRNRLT